MKMKTLLSTLTTITMFLVVLFAGCREDEFVEVIGVCPLVIATDPVNGFVSTPYEKTLSASFNEKMNPSTFTSSSFLLQLGSGFLSGTVICVDSIAAFKPDVPLMPLTTYTATIKKTVRDVRGNFLQNDYVWTFTTMPYLTLLPSPVLGGNVLGAGAYANGSTVTVSATANLLYTFTNWTANGIEVSTSSSYQFIMSGNKTLTANFAPVVAGKLAVNLSSSPIAGGINTGQGSYTAGEMVTVNAYPNSLYIFDNWTESGLIVSSSPNYQFALNANKTLVANYSLIPVSQYALVLSSTPQAGGTTYGSGAFNPLTIVTIIAEPNPAYDFVNWTESGVLISTLTNFTFQIKANRALLANFTLKKLTLSTSGVNGSVSKNPNQTEYNYGTSVQLVPSPNSGYRFVSWSGDASGDANPLVINMNANKSIIANFEIIPINFNLNINAVNGTILRSVNLSLYSSGVSVELTAVPNSGYKFSSWSDDASGSLNPITIIMNSVKTITANFVPSTQALGPGKIDLGGAEDFVALSKAGISTTGVTSIIGNLGVSPVGGSSITGFDLIMDTDGQTSHTPIVTGKVYAADYAVPTPAKLTKAINDFETAFTTANGLTDKVIVDLYAGDISGRILAPGLYKWGTGLLISNAGVSLNGGANDTWVFQIAQNLTVNNSAIIHLTGGALAKNVYWIVAGKSTLDTYVDFSGNILSKTLISINTGTIVNGKILAQTALTLNASTVVNP